MALDCKCGGKTAVIDSRPRRDNYLRRRRRCLECGERSTTVEIPVDTFEQLKRDITQANLDMDILKRAAVLLTKANEPVEQNPLPT